MDVDKMAALPMLPSESSFSAPPTDASSNVASLSSTPPTTVADSISLASDTPKPDNAPTTIVVEESIEASVTVALDPAPEPRETPSPGRARRGRPSAANPVYNISRLSGTAGHGKRRAKGDEVHDKRRRTISGDTLVSNGDAPPSAANSTDRLIRDGIEALDLQWSIRGPNTPRGARAQAKKTKESPRRISTRSAGATAETLATKVSSLGKRGRKIFEKANRMSRELRRLQDTNEFAHIDTKPVKHTVWSNGKYVDPDELVEDEAPAKKKTKTSKQTEEEEPEPEKKEEEAPKGPKPRRVKKYLEKGLYAGQEAPLDITKGLSAAEKKKLAEFPELLPSGKVNKTLPMPIYNGFRLLLNGRDFKLPFDVCNPLPPGQPKPDEWRKMTKNRFIGDAAMYWRKTDHFKDYQSKCVCTAEDGCAEDCQNRIMLYECDDTNCNAGKDHCQNRAFQNLQERTKKGGRYRVGVEVLKTSDRGYGVRANRCFEPNQIIMEYTGEIITEEECERRMNEIYKDNECYYLMSFDQNMIIDATTGNIARFVNHSCSPNCRMEKWIVGGQPRMALFAGNRPIQTGDELTYDYNFDPFSAKNVQKCLCGSANCRGVLGPKPKEVKVPKPPKEAKSPKKGVKATLKATAKATVKGGKRKLQELLAGGDDEADTSNAKKRKIKQPTGIKRSLSSASLKSLKGAAKGAATVVRKTASSISVNARAALAPKTPAAKATIKKSSSTSTLKTYSKSGKQLKLAASRSSSLTIVARPESDDENIKPGKGKRSPQSLKSTKSRKSILTSPGSAKVSKKTPKSVKSPRKGLELSRAAKIRLVGDE